MELDNLQEYFNNGEYDKSQLRIEITKLVRRFREIQEELSSLRRQLADEREENHRLVQLASIDHDTTIPRFLFTGSL